MTRAEALLVIRQAPGRRASVLDVAAACCVRVDTAQVVIAQLCRIGLVRTTLTRDRRGWTVYEMTERPDVELARRSPHPLRTLVSLGVLPVRRAVEMLRRTA